LWGGLLAVLTAILGRGSTAVGGYQDVVLEAPYNGQAIDSGRHAAVFHRNQHY
jgi:hypothetical protein